MPYQHFYLHLVSVCMYACVYIFCYQRLFSLMENNIIWEVKAKFKKCSTIQITLHDNLRQVHLFLACLVSENILSLPVNNIKYKMHFKESNEQMQLECWNQVVRRKYELIKFSMHFTLMFQIFDLYIVSKLSKILLQGSISVTPPF